MNTKPTIDFTRTVLSNSAVAPTDIKPEEIDFDNARNSKYHWDKMALDEIVIFEGNPLNLNSIRVASHQYGQANGKKFKTKVLEKDATTKKPTKVAVKRIL